MSITTKQQTKEVKEVQELEIESVDYPVKHVVRLISRSGVDDLLTGTSFSVATVEKTLAEYYERGYKLFNTHFIQSLPEGYEVLYILVYDPV